MTNLATIVREAQAAIADYQEHRPSEVEIARAYFGDDAWREAHRWLQTGELPRSIRGLEIVAVDIELDEAF